jgi:hypothetical protein
MIDVNSTRETWEIGLSSWIIQDGNYPDFTVERAAEFALEFCPTTVRRSQSIAKSAKRLGAARYEINCEIVYLKPEVWVLDFGLCAFQKSTPPKGLSVDKFITAEIYLGIDPFFYFERLYTISGMPPLVYSWRIKPIAQQTAPFIESREPSGQTFLVRDERRLGYKAIEKTDAWNDDDGRGEYVLNCARLDVPPKFKSATAI